MDSLFSTPLIIISILIQFFYIGLLAYIYIDTSKMRRAGLKIVPFAQILLYGIGLWIAALIFSSLPISLVISNGFAAILSQIFPLLLVGGIYFYVRRKYQKSILNDIKRLSITSESDINKVSPKIKKLGFGIFWCLAVLYTIYIITAFVFGEGEWTVNYILLFGSAISLSSIWMIVYRTSKFFSAGESFKAITILVVAFISFLFFRDIFPKLFLDGKIPIFGHFLFTWDISLFFFLVFSGIVFAL